MFRASARQKVERPECKLQPPLGHCTNIFGWTSAECIHGSIIHIPMECGRCEACLARSAWRHASRIQYAIGLEAPAAMISLTSRPGATWPEIMRAWSDMARALRRYAPALQYAAVKESGKLHGMKHLHVIAVGWSFVAQPVISRLWARYCGAFIVHVSRVDGAKAAHYVSKYLSKPRPHGLRGITYSLAFPKQHFPANFVSRGCRNEIPDSMPLLGCVGAGILVQYHAPGCRCLPEIIPLTHGERAWLACKRGRLSSTSPASSAQWSSAEPDSGSSPRRTVHPSLFRPLRPSSPDSASPPASAHGQ